MQNKYGISFTAFSLSIILHLLILYIAIFGLSFSKYTQTERVISIETLPVADVSNVPIKKPHVEETKEHEDAKKVVKTPKENKSKVEEPNLDAPQPKNKQEQPKDDAVVVTKKTVSKEIKQKQQKDEIAKTTTKQAAKIKKKKVINDQELDSLLKTLEEASDGVNDKSAIYAKKKQHSDSDKLSTGSYNENMRLSISEIDLIKQQIGSNWNMPIGANNLEQVRIFIYIALDKNGNVEQVRITDTKCGNASQNLCQIIAETAARAVWAASPLQHLQSERYNIWHEFNFVFDPSQMSR